MLNDSGKFSPRNDQDLHWSFRKVCQLYDLGESDDPSLLVFPPFACEYKELKEDSSKVTLNNLGTELKVRLKSIPISGNEASKSRYVCSYLVAGDENMENMIRKIPGHIAWLLEEVQKPVSDSRSGESIKKHRSSSSISEKSDTIDSGFKIMYWQSPDPQVFTFAI
ncbi:hypothetical protein C1646_750367 [Rhizophagus diaphanus]|nr:hypothetical protein C1646_750367 [Rhizophagus diaphanus] [Rhizophagus sp. MUCL 43196]